MPKIRLLIAYGCVVAAGCQLDVGAEPDAEPTGGGLSGDELLHCLETTAAAPVDLLFVIDNSHGMEEEQGALADRISEVIDELVSGDADGDGTADFPAARDIRVGVVTSDLGVGGSLVSSCEAPAGDDGALIAELDLADYADATQFAAAVGNALRPGTGGCGFEMPLKAAHRALTDQPANDGFLRQDSLLAIVVLTNEDDCSADDLSIFNPHSPDPLEARCETHGSELWGVDHIADLATWGGRSADQLVFAVIAGIPVDAIDTGYDAMLAHQSMQRFYVDEVDRSDSAVYLNGIPQSCASATSVAVAPRRLVEAARALDAIGADSGGGPQVMLRSICEPDLGVGKLIAPLATSLAAPCTR